MDRSPLTPEDACRFEALFDDVYVDLLRFAQRRVDRDHAEDVAAEALLVAWRRFDELPATHDDARAWLFGIARHVMLNAGRSARRQAALGVRISDDALRETACRSADIESVATRVDLARAWRRLSFSHQETLALAVLDGLDAPHAAAVLEISAVAFRLRLSRARRALRLHLHHLPQSPTLQPADDKRSTCHVR